MPVTAQAYPLIRAVRNCGFDRSPGGQATRFVAKSRTICTSSPLDRRLRISRGKRPNWRKSGIGLRARSEQAQEAAKERRAWIADLKKRTLAFLRLRQRRSRSAAQVLLSAGKSLALCLRVSVVRKLATPLRSPSA